MQQTTDLIEIFDVGLNMLERAQLRNVKWDEWAEKAEGRARALSRSLMLKDPAASAAAAIREQMFLNMQVKAADAWDARELWIGKVSFVRGLFVLKLRRATEIRNALVRCRSATEEARAILSSY